MLKKHKKVIFYSAFIFSVIIFIALSIISIDRIKNRYISLKYSESVLAADYQAPFTINKIVYFSSANCKADVNPNSSFTINDLYQYTDFAIFINNNADGSFNVKNTLKKVDITDIEFSLKPNLRNTKFIL